VDPIDPQILQTTKGILADILGREDLVQRVASPGRPGPVLGRDLGGDIEAAFGMPANEITEEPLAVPFPIGPGGIEEIATAIHRLLQRLTRLLIVRAAPLPHPPHAIADLAHPPAQPTEGPVLHRSSSR